MTAPPLQPGQYWRTRSGEIRYVASIIPEWARFPFPVQVISRSINGEYRSEWYRLRGEWQNSGESSHDLVTYLPDCTSLDWVPPHQKKYYKTGTEHFGYFLVDSKDTYFWITPDGREVRQCGSPDTLKLPPFVEITKEEAETRVKKSDAPETVIEINDTVLSLLNTPTALLINGEIAGLITEVEFGLMNDEIRQKTPVARQYLGVSVSPPEILCPPVQPVESPEDWVTQDRGPARPNIDERRYVDKSGFVGGWRDAGAISWGRPAFHGDSINGQKLELRCRRKDLPPVADPPPQPKPPSHHTAPEVWSMIEKSRRANHLGNNRTAVGNLIRICSAQQSMLSELSSQVDALRSQINSGAPH